MIGNLDRMDVQRKKRVVPEEEFRSNFYFFMFQEITKAWQEKSAR